MAPSKVWGTSKDGTIEFISFQEKYYDGVLKVMESFFVNESLCVGTGVNKSPEALKDMEKFVMEMMTRSLILMARDVSNDKVVGVAMNTIFLKEVEAVYDRIINEILSTECARATIRALVEIESKFNFFMHFEIDSIMELLYLSVLPEYCGRGIAQTLTSYSIEMGTNFRNGKNLELLPKYLRKRAPAVLIATMTSKYTQKIGRKLGFEEFVTVSHKNFIFDGKSFAQRLGEPESVSIIVAKEL